MAFNDNNHKLALIIIIIPLCVIGIMLCLFIFELKNISQTIHTQLDIIHHTEPTIKLSDAVKSPYTKIDRQIARTYIFLGVSFFLINLGMVILIILLSPTLYRILLRPLLHVDNKINKLVTSEKGLKKYNNFSMERFERNFNALLDQFLIESNKYKRLEKELTRARQEIDQIYSISGEGIRIIDKDFNIISINKTFEDLALVRSDECLHKKCYEVFTTPACDTPHCNLKKLLSGKVERIEEETERIRTDGTKAYCILNASCIYDENNRPIAVAESFKDITDLKQSQEKLKKLYREIKEKNKELEDFVYITTHDLRSPLINLKGFTAELEENIQELGKIFNKIKVSKAIREEIYTLYWEDMPECLHFINSATSKMEDLVNSLLKLSRLKQEEINIKELDVNQIILNVKSNFGTEIKNTKTKIKVGNLPSVRGDENQINQVFSNLVGNALHYLHPRRPGVIRITGEQKGKEVIFCVEDNGIGIAKKYQKKIFQVFQRLEPDICPGEGVGLSIVYNILEKHGGQIWVESEENIGSKFFFSLPS
ncbi:MAG: ATP-binding protein [bacterium]